MKYKKTIIVLLVCMVLLFQGCGKGGGTKVVLTAGFAREEVFRIETLSCMKPEIMVYLTNMQNQYEEIFGEEIWQSGLDGMTLEQNVKDTALARIAQIKSMNLLAEKYQVVLGESEKRQVKEVAKTYFDSLNEGEKECLNVTYETIEGLYLEYALADKVYQYIIRDINPEISDDEARTITVQHVLIKTYALDGMGTKLEYSEENKEEAYEKAQEVWRKAEEGEDFENLILQYSEDSQGTYSFGKGEMEEAFELAAFNLGKDEISPVVETSYGYHVIKCINTFNREETDNNKVKIVKQRREEVFGQEYNSFVASLTKTLNEELWEEVAFIRNDDVTTRSFFQMYDDGVRFSVE